MVERLASGERYVYTLLYFYGHVNSKILGVYESETMARQAIKDLVKQTHGTADDYAVEIAKLIPATTKDADK